MRRLTISGLFGVVLLLAACGDDNSSILLAQKCAKRMTLARDGHDTLAVLLACDQLEALAGVRDAAATAQASANAAVAISASRVR